MQQQQNEKRDWAAILRLLETFQECVAWGDQASLLLETRNGNQFANFSVKMPVTKPGMFKNENISSHHLRSAETNNKLRLENWKIGNGERQLRDPGVRLPLALQRRKPLHQTWPAVAKMWKPLSPERHTLGQACPAPAKMSGLHCLEFWTKPIRVRQNQTIRAWINKELRRRKTTT